jgi:hypothetical protein
MRAFVRGATLVVAALVLGCNWTPEPSPQVMSGPHRGTTIRLPEDRGFVELTNEPEIALRKKDQITSIVAYFLKIDGKSALEPPPTDVAIVVDRAKERAETIPLAAEPKSDDPAGGSRFASKPGPHHLGMLRGTLKAKLAGQDISIAVSGSR